MVLQYCKSGNLRDKLNRSGTYDKINHLFQISRGLNDIHNAGKVHKDLHPGNILFHYNNSYISDFGLCQPANYNQQSSKKEGIYGVLPYIAPEVLCGYQYIKASDIYSFGIVMNEYLSEEIPYINIPHDYILAVKICKGLRPKISEDLPKLFMDLIEKCWDIKSENRPTAKKLYQTLTEWHLDILYDKEDSKIYSQIKEYEKIRENKLEMNLSNENRSKNIQTHPQAIYTSRMLEFPELDLSSYKICKGNFCNSFNHIIIITNTFK